MPDSAKVPAKERAIAFVDLQAQRARIAPRIDAAIARVLAHGAFIMGPEVIELEKRLSQHCGAKHTVTCSSGTDALLMGLMARDVGRGDAVFVPSFTFAATAEVVVLAGATPVFVDVNPDTFNMDAASLNRAVAVARQTGLKPVCVIPVDLFGQPADIDAVNTVAAEHHLWVLNDAAQSYGATYGGKRLGVFGGATATSFYPTKPLGCYGDGGAIFTNDDELHRRLVQVRVHGQGRDRNETVRIGLTARIDSIQAAVLLEKLAIFDDECATRQALAARYDQALGDVVRTPVIADGSTSVWAQYTIRSPRRDRIVATLTAKQIRAEVYYPKPIHQQTPYRGFPVAGGGLPVTDQLAHEVVSLPLHPYLNTDDQDRVIAAVRAAVT
ncbi:MAG: DegT/DnrJ/EryC1/StrS family aminotransferase [Rhodospirillaceae bacterium]|nr:MAG: DegT/DnrJ/EryC1/StrS family aminotransferase [Rhodospirillaceae bacterium]